MPVNLNLPQFDWADELRTLPFLSLYKVRSCLQHDLFRQIYPVSVASFNLAEAFEHKLLSLLSQTLASELYRA